MKRIFIAALAGTVLGAASWFVVPLVSNKFEPFDNSTGLFIGQALMSVAAFYFGFSQGIKSVLMFVVGAYAGLNLYPYIFGTSENRGWAILLLFTSLFLCIYPLASGLLGKIVGFGLLKYKNGSRTTPRNAARLSQSGP